MVRKLLPRGWMVDYAHEERCASLRVVIGWETKFETVEALARDVVAVRGRLLSVMIVSDGGDVSGSNKPRKG